MFLTLWSPNKPSFLICCVLAPAFRIILIYVHVACLEPQGHEMILQGLHYNHHLWFKSYIFH